MEASTDDGTLSPQSATWPDERPSDRAGPGAELRTHLTMGPRSPARVGLVSVHTSPLEQPGSGDSGGMNVYLSALARGLVARGTEVHVFTRAGGADLPPTVTTADGVAVHHLPMGPPGISKEDLASHLCAFYLGFAAHPATAGLDLVHGHYWMSGWVGRQARRRLGLPLVQSFHTLAREKNARLAPGDVRESALRVAAEDRIVAAADAVLAPTAAEAALLRTRYHSRPGAVQVVAPGVDLDVFRPSPDRHAEHQSLGGGRIVLFVGRLQPLKAPDVAVRALAALDRFLPDDGVPTRLIVVGGASGAAGETMDPAALRQLAASLGVEDRVAFLAPRRQEELAALYRAADVVVMPSHSESFGLVALEAQASGTPVVAAAVGGLVHVLGGPTPASGRGAANGRGTVTGGGTLVEGHDPVDYAAALAPYLTDARVRADAASAGRRHAERFGWDRTAEATLEVYARVAGGAASHAEAAGASQGA